MHYKVFKGVCSLLLMLSLQQAYAYSKPVLKDSVGIEKKQGEVFIVHKIEQGETLFSISRLYGVTVDDLKSSNTEININKLDVGDSLKVPMFPELFRGKKTHHTVKEGETLFRISRQYDVSVENIRLWNATGNQPLSVGQELIIYLKDPAEDSLARVRKRYITHDVQKGETLYAISKSYEVSVDSLKLLNDMQDEAISLGQLLLIKKKPIDTVAVDVKKVPVPEIKEEKPAEKKVKTAATHADEEEEDEMPTVDNKGRKLTKAEALEREKERVKAIRAEEKKALSEYKKISEIGFAAAIPGQTETQKFLALHRSAPVGTIMQVRNEMNNVSVFVRVVGKLPDTGMNSKVTIRISQAAYEKLGGINERFPIEITYLK